MQGPSLTEHNIDGKMKLGLVFIFVSSVSSNLHFHLIIFISSSLSYHHFHLVFIFSPFSSSSSLHLPMDPEVVFIVFCIRLFSSTAKFVSGCGGSAAEEGRSGCSTTVSDGPDTMRSTKRKSLGTCTLATLFLAKTMRSAKEERREERAP